MPGSRHSCANFTPCACVQFLIITFVIGALQARLVKLPKLHAMCCNSMLLTRKRGNLYLEQRGTTSPPLAPAVSFEGFYFDRTDALILASSRVAGICTGVMIALVLTCTVFPVSGTGEVRRGVSHADACFRVGMGQACLQ